MMYMLILVMSLVIKCYFNFGELVLLVVNVGVWYLVFVAVLLIVVVCFMRRGWNWSCLTRDMLSSLL